MGSGNNPEAAKLTGYPGFDWLRIVLASVVVLGHEGVRFPGPIDGGLAVDVFFALSGWLIGGILLHTERHEMPRFFFNRATRIWMPYVAAIALLYGFAALYEGIDRNWAKYLFYDATFTHQLFTHFPRASFEMPLAGSGNQFWSISVEEQFYLFAPIVMMLVPGGKRLPAWLVIAVPALVLNFGAPITLGVIAAILRRDHGDWHLRRWARTLVLVGTALALGMMFVLPWPFLADLFSIGVVLSLAVPGTRVPLPVFLGGASYPLYLNHWMAAFFAHGIVRHLVRMPAAGYIAIAYAASLAIATIAYWLVDRNVLMRRQRWFRPSRGRALGVTAYALVTTGIAGGLVIG